LLFTLAFKGCGPDMSKESIVSRWNTDIGSDVSLLNYLRTTVEVGGRNQTISELIARSCQNKNFDEIKKQTNSTLSFEKFSTLSCLVGKPTSPCFKITIMCADDYNSIVDIDTLEYVNLQCRPALTDTKREMVPLYKTEDGKSIYARVIMGRVDTAMGSLRGCSS
jgi:hypothetical protein